jgi:hypothetical protein
MNAGPDSYGALILAGLARLVSPITPRQFAGTCGFPAISVRLTPLCRLYENAVGSVSNSYALASTLGSAQRIWERPHECHSVRHVKERGRRSGEAAEFLATIWAGARSPRRLSNTANGVRNRAAPFGKRYRSLSSSDAPRLHRPRPSYAPSNPRTPRSDNAANALMNRAVRRGDVADVRHGGAVQLLSTFVAMAVAEWRKLVAEVIHAFAGKRSHRPSIKPKQ